MAKDPLEVLREKAQEAIARGQYQEARLIYQQALGHRSDHPDLHYGIAAVCFVLNDLHSAAYHFKEVTRLEPTLAGAHINLGAVCNRLGEYENALTALRRGIQLDKTRAEGFYNLALVHKHLDQLELAIAAYREALRVNPKMYEAHYNLGNIYFEKGQFHLAINHYRQALEIRPDWDKAKNALASALEEQAKVEGASVPLPHPAAYLPVPISSHKEVRFLDPSRLVDPNIHGKWLRDLHHLVVDIETNSQELLKLLQIDVEKAIRELSICILTPTDMQLNLDDKIEKFDLVMTHLQKAREGLQKRILRARLMSDQLTKI